ncbi:DNA recombination protein RmuC [Salinibacterium sp.]|uniref:DNA recombination protein RmuC n=1 Tax=Salinibacterium sp. TaxID=1915057 RepID=UPI00286C6644|nr:DNA recombination protein RmuC [Salinibacterium sp.]
MDPLIALIIGIVLGVLVGAVIGVLVGRARAAASIVDPALVEARHLATLTQLQADERAVQSTLAADHAAIKARAGALREQVDALQAQYQDVIDRQRMDAKAQADREQRESKVLQALTPVQETLRTMQQKVTDLETQRSQQYGAIAEQLNQSRISGDQIRATTESLASALRNNGTRGVWGEAQLRNVVEAAGLTHRVDFELQSTITTDAGRGRPDMIVRLPGGKSIAVDAKVPFDAYLEANAIPMTAPDVDLARRTALLAKHVKAVRSHIDALASKTYWEGLDASPEFVVAFIPSESLLASALEADSSLLDYSFRKRVALASPVNLWAVLKTVALTWQQDLLTDDANRLFTLSQSLYDRIKTMAGHADSLRSSIERTVRNYNDFASSLETRVLVTARQINRLDESKILGEATLIESSPRSLTAPELAAPGDDAAASTESG